MQPSLERKEEWKERGKEGERKEAEGRQVFVVAIQFITKSLLNLLQYCLFYVVVFWFCCFFFFWPSGIRSPRDLVSPTRNQTHSPCTGRGIRNHWTTSESLCLYTKASKVAFLRSFFPSYISFFNYSQVSFSDFKNSRD